MDIMVFDRVQPRWPAAAGLLVAAGLFLAGSMGASPAKAEEDTNMFNSMLGFFGMQFDKEQDSIDYRARAPIVVPPHMDLPQPKEAARGQAWPTDPDIAERRRAALDSRRPAPQLTRMREPSCPVGITAERRRQQSASERGTAERVPGQRGHADLPLCALEGLADRHLRDAFG